MSTPDSKPCDPPGACASHGRCWTHSTWDDASAAGELQTTAAIAVIRGILERLPNEAVRLVVLNGVLENRCRQCLDYSADGSFWCCYDSRGG